MDIPVVTEKFDLRQEAKLYPPFYGTDERDTLIVSRDYYGYLNTEQAREGNPDSPERTTDENHYYGLVNECHHWYKYHKLKPGGMNDRSILMGLRSNPCKIVLVEPQCKRPIVFRSNRHQAGTSGTGTLDFHITGIRPEETSTYPVKKGSDIFNLKTYTNPLPMIIDEVKKTGQSRMAALYQLLDYCFKATQPLSSPVLDRESCFALYSDANRITPYEFHRSLMTEKEQQEYDAFRMKWPSTRKEKPSMMDYPRGLPGALVPIILKEDVNQELERGWEEMERKLKERGAEYIPPPSAPFTVTIQKERNTRSGYVTRSEGYSNQEMDAYKLHLIFTWMYYIEYPPVGGLKYRDGMYYREI